jgi:hypothetical protein
MCDMQPQEATVAVAVRPGAALSARPRLFAALAEAFGVRFRAWGDSTGPPEAVLVLGAVPPAELGRLGVPVLAMLDGARHDAEDVRVLDRPAVDRRVRAIVLPGERLGPPLEDLDGNAEVLAVAGSGPVWTRSRGRDPVHRLRVDLPELGPTEMLLEALSPRRALALLAVVHFLRSLTAEDRTPPVRAAFVFDDPNLRWRSYGFIDYRRLVDHAEAHSYHAAMAMIPLDAGRPNPAALALFRQRPDRLSLVFHGNNHVKRELMAPDEASAVALAAQALRRIGRFERRSGLRVDRVMTAPHGMCSPSVARALGAVGFDALCAIHPLPWAEQPPQDRLLAGWEPAEFADGCAVIPRFTLDWTAAEIALRAFLGHPLVVYGHHQDVARGFEPLEEAAARINRLGEVEWTSLGRIALGNHALRMSGDTARVRPFAGRVVVTLPERARALAIEPPRGAGPALLGWVPASGGPLVPFGVPVERVGGCTYELRLRVAGSVDPLTVAPPAWRPWPLLRRAATEARDRALPLRHRPPVFSRQPSVRAAQ